MILREDEENINEMRKCNHIFDNDMNRRCQCYTI